MMNWKAIDTAPKGEYIIGYDPALKRPFIMMWNERTGKFMAADSVFDDETPTHWHPLPTLPNH